MKTDTLRQILNRTTEIIRRKHMALATERSYCGWIKRYYDYCLTIPKELTAEAKMESFLTYLAKVHDVSASTQNGAFHAIRFLYIEVIARELDVSKVNSLRATRPEQIRHAPSVQDTLALLHDVRDEASYPANLVVRMLYRRRLEIQVVPHELRHAYATHCLDRGVNIKALQEAMGHAQIETTAGYCHAEALSVRSPLDALPSNVVPFEVHQAA